MPTLNPIRAFIKWVNTIIPVLEKGSGNNEIPVLKGVQLTIILIPVLKRVS